MPGEFYIEAIRERLSLSDILASIEEAKVKLDQLSDILSNIITAVEDMNVKLDRLRGDVQSGSVIADWQSGTGTSGETGADLITLGADSTRYKLHSLVVNISALTDGAVIIVKLFMKVHGTERKVYQQSFTKGADPDGLWIANGTVGIHEALRVELQSDKAGDNNKAVEYDYMLEEM